MRKSDKKPLLEKLAALSEQERLSLYQQAARMRKAVVLEKRKKNNKRSKYLLQTQGDELENPKKSAVNFVKNRSRLPSGLEEWVLKLLAEKDFDTKAAATDARKETQKGIIISVASGHCKIVTVSGDNVYKCLIRPEWAMTQRSDLAVGDYAEFSHSDDGSYLMEVVLPRRSLLARPDPHDRRIKRAIAANIDVVVVVTSVKIPVLNTNLIDRYLLAIEYNGIEPLICVNKIDLLDTPDDIQQLEQALEPYHKLGIKIVQCSAVAGEGIENLKQALAGETAVLVGHSGVGKSSLLNTMAPGLHIPVREVHKASRRGRHTTVHSHLYYLQPDIRIIDTPGVRSFGLDDIKQEQLSWYFREFDNFAENCKYSNCTHTHEPNCAVKQAIQQGLISEQRYKSYCRIFVTL